MAQQENTFHQRWIVSSIIAITLIAVLAAATVGYFGSRQISESIRNELQETYPTIQKVYRLVSIVQETGYLFENLKDAEPSELANIIEEQQRLFDGTFYDISVSNSSDLLWTIRKNFLLFIAEGLSLHEKSHTEGVPLNWDQGSKVHEKSRLLNRDLQNCRINVTANYRSHLFRIEASARQFNQLLGFFSILTFILSFGLLFGMHYFFKKLDHRNQQLEKAKQVSDLANQAKSQFMAVMSHEIRTPMNGIVGMAELLGKSDLTAVQKQYVKTILQSADTQLDLLGNILDMSKLEAQKMELETIAFCLRDVLESAVLQAMGRCQHKGLELLLNVSPNIPLQFLGDPKKISQVLTNLLNNALKFTESGHIHVIVEHQTDHIKCIAFVSISISDSGIGIAKDKQEHIFERFAQADSSTTRHYGGTGLGLSICKDLCQLMGAQLSLKSELGQGSIFTLNLSLELAESLEPELFPLHQQKIVLALHSPCIRRTLAQQLNHWGFEVEEASSRESLYKCIYEKQNLCILIDKDMLEGSLSSMRHHLELLCKSFHLILYGDHSYLDQQSQNQDGDPVSSLPTPILCRSVLLSALQPCCDKAVWSFIAQKEKLLNETHEVATKATQWEAARHLKVLMAEDNETNQWVARELFANIGISLEMVDNGLKAVEQCQHKNYDLIFLDCLMPVMDGYEATRKIRALNHPNASTTIIAVTANVSEQERQNCIMVGMNDHLSKPLRFQLLSRCIQKWISPAKLNTLLEVDAAPKVPESAAKDAVAHKDIFDFESVLKITGNKPLVAEKIMEAFLKNAPKNILDLQEAFHKANWNEVHRLAHSLKSSSSYAGAIQLSQIFKKLEELSRQDHPQGPSIEKELQEVLKAKMDYDRIVAIDFNHLLTKSEKG